MCVELYFITAFSIGDTQINNESGGIPYYLGFEAIEFYGINSVQLEKSDMCCNFNPKKVENVNGTGIN